LVSFDRLKSIYSPLREDLHYETGVLNPRRTLEAALIVDFLVVRLFV
jgi:hypothetical protein